MLQTALLLLCVSCLHVPRPPSNPAGRTVYLTVHVPKDRPFVEELEYARQVFAPHDVQLEIADVLLLEEVPRADEQWRDGVHEEYRHYDGTVHIFFVEECFDSDVGADGNPKDLRGIAWNKKGQAYMHFAAVAADAPITTFSHEIGHVLDLDHILATDPTNIMCQCTREEGASFTKEQGAKMRIP